MHKISIIIVNYNVEFFLEQCLHSVNKAIKNMDAEIIVVDNNSVDGSIEMLKKKFPSVKLIINKENAGFSKANNQAIRASNSEYILLLNPDTVVQEDTLQKCINYMDANPQTGALGVKMIDGKGNFLPESKRSFPTPAVAFYKMFGISSIFPRSKTFGRYHLGFLDNDHIHEVDVLPGAFMLIRSKVLDETGLLDENFFMYGEDIDLSYRIKKTGSKVIYFPETTIIHYKGESTKKGSINYVVVFYKAMIIFARKHFTGRKAGMLAFLINMAIILRAMLSIFKRLTRNILLPLLDLVMFNLGFYFIIPFWEQVRFHVTNAYPEEITRIVIPSYTLLWLTSILFAGGYSKNQQLTKTVKGILYGTIFILVAYALFPENLRFSRALILIGTVWAVIASLLTRITLHLLPLKFYTLWRNAKKRMLIIGKKEEAQRVEKIIQQSNIRADIRGIIYPDHADNKEGYQGNLNQLKELVFIEKIDELIFCSKEINTTNIIDIMLQLSNTDVDFKIAPPESLSIIGSNSIDTSGDLYMIHFNSIGKTKNRRKKRLFDLLSAFLLLSLSPLVLLIVKQRGSFLKNMIQVLAGKKTMVGYNSKGIESNKHLPPLRSGILNPCDQFSKTGISQDFIENINILYAKDYKMTNDMGIILRSLKALGRESKENLSN